MVQNKYGSDERMRLRNTKIGRILVIIYVILVMIAFSFYLYNIKQSAFAGVYIVVLTFPWSLLLIFFQFILVLLSGKYFTFVSSLLLILFGLINAVFLYRLGYQIEFGENNRDGSS